MKKLDDYHYHEALDRTGLLMDIVEKTLMGHPAISDNKIWEAQVEKSHSELYELYQMIAKKHLRNRLLGRDEK